MAFHRRISTTAVLALAASVALTGAATAATATAASAAATTPPAAVAAPAVVKPAAAAFQGTLPAPTGRFAAGEDVIHLTDWDRPDPWVPAAGPRQLTVSMFYPAVAGTGTQA